LDGTGNGGEGRLMEDDIDAIDRIADDMEGADISFDQLHAVDDILYVFTLPRGEVVEHADIVSAIEQSAHQVRSYESGAAGDQALHTQMGLCAAWGGRPGPASPAFRADGLKRQGSRQTAGTVASCRTASAV